MVGTKSPIGRRLVYMSRKCPPQKIMADCKIAPVSYKPKSITASPLFARKMLVGRRHFVVVE